MKGDIQRVFQEHGDEYMERNRDCLTVQHINAVRCIQDCRTSAAGWIQFECLDCQTLCHVERSCGNRMCPTCQTAKTAQWLNKRLEEQLPTHYFMITFTVPEELNPFFLYKPKEGFNAFFKAASGALRKLAANPRFLGVDLPGFFGVLHTWGRTLNFHPHIHFIVPGGGVDKKKRLWRSTQESFYAPGQALAKVCRGIFRELMAGGQWLECINPAVWDRKWVVDCQAMGHNPQGAMKYLAPYVFKTAITDKRIVAVSGSTVTFSYEKSGARRKRKMTLQTHEFIRRYLMHVLPAGFMRIRHYGFMGAGANIEHKELVALVQLAQAFDVKPVAYTPPQPRVFACPACGRKLVPTLLADRNGLIVDKFKHFAHRLE